MIQQIEIWGGSDRGPPKDERSACIIVIKNMISQIEYFMVFVIALGEYRAALEVMVANFVNFSL